MVERCRTSTSHAVLIKPANFASLFVSSSLYLTANVQAQGLISQSGQWSECEAFRNKTTCISAVLSSGASDIFTVKTRTGAVYQIKCKSPLSINDSATSQGSFMGANVRCRYNINKFSQRWVEISDLTMQPLIWFNAPHKVGR